tara:strand:- start:546 stop:1685 length:1140 start_codon:yes stop_codon:yes gene_type:complete
MQLAQRVSACNGDIVEHPEFGRLTGVVFMGEAIIDPACPTAATNGRDVTYGTKFCGGLNQKQLRYVVLHESFHKGLRHCVLYKEITKRYPDESNQAQDYVINGLIEEVDPTFQFVERPCALLINPKYQGMGFIEVLKDIIKNPPPPSESKTMDEHGEMDDDPELGDAIEDALIQGKIVSDRIRGEKAGGNPLDVLVRPSNTAWRDATLEFMQDVCEGDELSRICPPNKRLLPSGFLMWSHYSETVGEIILACDTSGSMGSVYPVVFGEIAHICQTLLPESVRVIWWDSRVRSEQVFTPDNYEAIASLMKPQGGGGTTVSAVADYIQEKRYEPRALIYLTDGYIESEYRTPALPILWGVVDNTRFVPRVGKKVDICSFTI